MYSRFAKIKIKNSLTDTRAVLISRPRQSGKITLAADIASDDIPFLTLDDVTVLQAAIDDPVGFIRGLDRAVVDEVQRAPNLLLSIKNAVDEDTTPGRFLPTAWFLSQITCLQLHYRVYGMHEHSNQTEPVFYSAS